MPKNDDYDVGYKKPPQKTRFKQGQSGNPKGRPRGARNMSTILSALMKEKQSIKENGVIRRVTRKEALLLSLIGKAMKGDVNAGKYLIELVQAGELGEEQPQDKPLSLSDQQILEDYIARTRPQPVTTVGDKADIECEDEEHDDE